MLKLNSVQLIVIGIIVGLLNFAIVKGSLLYNINYLQHSVETPNNSFQFNINCKSNSIIGIHYFVYLNSTNYLECNKLGMGLIGECVNDTQSSALKNESLSCETMLKFKPNVNKSAEQMRPLYNNSKITQLLMSPMIDVENFINEKYDNFSTVSTYNSEAFWRFLISELWREINYNGYLFYNFNYTDTSNIDGTLNDLVFYANNVVETFSANFQIFERIIKRISELPFHRKKSTHRHSSSSIISKFISYRTKSGQKVDNNSQQMWNIEKRIYENLQKTLNQTNDFQNSIKAYKKNEKYLNQIGQTVSIDHLLNPSMLFESIRSSSRSNWDMICDYGFWFLTYSIYSSDGPKTIENSTKRSLMDSLLLSNIFRSSVSFIFFSFVLVLFQFI
jgi:hypothetical protein